MGCGKETDSSSKSKVPASQFQTQTTTPNTVVAQQNLTPELKALQGLWKSDCQESHEMGNGYFYRNMIFITNSQYSAENTYFLNQENCVQSAYPLFSVQFNGTLTPGKILTDASEGREVDFTIHTKSINPHDQNQLNTLQWVYQTGTLNLNQSTSVNLDKGVRFLPDMSLRTSYLINGSELTLALDECPTDITRSTGPELESKSVKYKKSQRLF